LHQLLQHRTQLATLLAREWLARPSSLADRLLAPRGAGKRWFFVMMTLLAIIVGTVGFARFTRSKDWSSHLAIGLILGGGLGNLYDRIIYACVRDFLHPLPGMKLPFGWTWPWGGSEVWPYVSNIADAFLIVGVVMLVWKSFFPPKDSAAK
jgi:signal peptidase II